MTDAELIAYFEHAQLPETLRLDRATTQYNVKDAVAQNIDFMKSNLKDEHSRHRLNRIAYAIEHPYDGPEIPRF